MAEIFVYMLLFSLPFVCLMYVDNYTPVFNEIGLKGIVVENVKSIVNGKELIVKIPCNISTDDIEKNRLKIEQSLNCKMKVEYLDKQKVKLILYENNLPDNCTLTYDDTEQ